MYLPPELVFDFVMSRSFLPITVEMALLRASSSVPITLYTQEQGYLILGFSLQEKGFGNGSKFISNNEIDFYRLWYRIRIVIGNLPNQTSRVKLKGWLIGK